MAAEVMQNRKIQATDLSRGRPFALMAGCNPSKKAPPIPIRAGAPLVPVAIVGTDKVLPFGSGTPRPGKITIKVMKPLETRSRTLKQRNELTAEARTLIAAAVEEQSGVREHA